MHDFFLSFFHIFEVQIFRLKLCIKHSKLGLYSLSIYPSVLYSVIWCERFWRDGLYANFFCFILWFMHVYVMLFILFVNYLQQKYWHLSIFTKPTLPPLPGGGGIKIKKIIFCMQDFETSISRFFLLFPKLKKLSISAIYKSNHPFSSST